jgi:hypothetical protein
MITIDCSLADLLKDALERLEQGQTGETRMLITFALRALENSDEDLSVKAKDCSKENTSDATQPVSVEHLRETVHKHISVFLSSKRPGDVFRFTDVNEYLKFMLGFSYGQSASIRSLVIRKMISRRLEHLKKERIIFSVIHSGTSYSVGFSLLPED